MDHDPSTPWGGDDLELETEDEYRQRSGMRVVDPKDLGEDGPALKTINEVNSRLERGAKPNRLAPLFALAVVALIGWEVAASLLQHHITPPKDADWRAAVSELNKERKSGEPVLLAPFWVEHLGRSYLGGVLDLKLATLSDVDRYSRVFELSIRGARHRWLSKLTPKQSWTYGAVTLSLFKKPAVTLLTDFTARALEATVTTAPAQRACRKVGERFVCGGGTQWVGPHLAEVEHRPYRCIYAHPVRGKRLRIDFSRVRLGTSIVGYSGIDDFENRKRAKGPVRLQVFVGDQLVGGILHQNHWPWQRFEADTRKFAGPNRTVRFEITSEQPAHRTFCFHAEARR
ncbi:MAG: hypothetical protein CSA65_08320 [Proteobacteria bacterium]|nr:MAG: hypothetical protein CSA65_08320 [Pseudomonadota bacterium]